MIFKPVNFISICKNVIASNNKANWVAPKPAIRVSNTKHGRVVLRSNKVGIVDAQGNVVATIESTVDGEPLIGCGAKVGLFTMFEVIEMESKP